MSPNLAVSGWKKVIWLNCVVLVGIVLGFLQNSERLSANSISRIAVFFLAFFNLLFLVVQPRLAQLSQTARSGRVFYEMWRAIAEKPLVSILVAIQLWGVARFLASVIALSRAVQDGSASAQHLTGRVIVACVLLSVVGILWGLSAVGLWQVRRWAWWMAVILNGLSAGVTIFLQFFSRDKFLIDGISTAMVILLLTPFTQKLYMPPKNEGSMSTSPPIDQKLF